MAKVFDHGGVVISSRDGTVDVVGKPDSILEYFEASSRGDESPAQTVNGNGSPVFNFNEVA